MTPENESSSEPIVGEPHGLTGIRRDTKDNGDGSVTLAVEVIAEHLPEEFSTSATGTVWQIAMREEADPPVSFYASRLPMKDLKGGGVLLRLAALASDLPPGTLYGHKNTCVALTIAMTAGHPGHAKALDRAERMQVLRRVFVHCGEPEFLAWIEAEAIRRGYPQQSAPQTRGQDTPTTEDRAAEYVYLVAHIHSRDEIVESTRAANAVDSILRDYRSALWRMRNETPLRATKDTK